MHDGRPSDVFKFRVKSIEFSLSALPGTQALNGRDAAIQRRISHLLTLFYLALLDNIEDARAGGARIGDCFLSGRRPRVVFSR